jgi:outer membrane protein assembly factor BamD (BamD/ComL family)
MRSWQRYLWIALVGILAGSITPVQAQRETMGDPDAALSTLRTGYPRPDRKRPSFWSRRPAAETPEAQWQQARTRADAGQYRQAAKAADALVRQWHESPEAVEAQLLLARMLEQRNRLPAAFEAYQYLIVYYPGRFDYGLVVERQFQIARALRQRLSRRLNFGPGETRVREKFAQIVRNAPQGPRAPEAQLAVGALYQAEGNLDDAILAYETLNSRYPDHALAREAVMQAARCRHQLAQRHPRDEALSLEALATLYGILQSDPGHPDAPEIRTLADGLLRDVEALHYEKAAFYDRIQRNPVAAQIAYTEFLRRFPDARQATKIRNRLRELEREQGEIQ